MHAFTLWDPYGLTRYRCFHQVLLFDRYHWLWPSTQNLILNNQSWRKAFGRSPSPSPKKIRGGNIPIGYHGILVLGFLKKNVLKTVTGKLSKWSTCLQTENP